MSKIFISHSSTNNASALAIADWLEENGWADCFLDVTPARGLAPGERWQEALKTAADRCEAVIFLISPAWRDSRWCLAEFLLAKQLGKTIFGVLIEPTVLESLPHEMTSEWQLCDLVSGDDRRAISVAQEPIVPPTIVSFAEAGLLALRTGLRRAGLDPTTFPWPPADDPERTPYRGMKALESQDAAVFFGRDAAIVRGLDAIRRLRERGVEQMLVVLGASGAGKSSFLRAGILPRLARDDRHFLPLPVIRPGRAAVTGDTGLVASFEAAFRDLRSPRVRADIRQALREHTGLDGLLNQIQQQARPRVGSDIVPPTVVVPIDQGEELFGAEGQAEADHLLSLLAYALTESGVDDAGPVAIRQRPIVVIAIRSDAYERLQTEPRLSAVKSSLFSLLPIQRAQYQAIIEGPAQRETAAGRRLHIEPALTERLLHDAAEGADALPLLAFALERLLVEHGGRGELTTDAYDALGGVSGAIEAAVQAAFVDPKRDPVISTDPVERQQLLRLGFIPWLARVDQDSGERKRRVARWNEIPPDARPLLQRLIDQRLLVRDRRNLGGQSNETIVVEVAHEALLRQWPTLTAWLDEDATALAELDAVRRAAAEWFTYNRAVAWLVHTGERLRAAELLLQREHFNYMLGDDGRAYLEECRHRDDAVQAEREGQLQRIASEQTRVAEEQTRTARAQRRAQRLVGAIGLIVLAAGTWIVAEARQLAQLTSRVLVAEIDRASDAGFASRPLRFAMLATRGGWLWPAGRQESAQLARAAHASRQVAALIGHGSDVWSATFSPDGARVVTASGDRSARVWNAATGEKIAWLSGHSASVASAAFKPDGSAVVTASDDGTARIWDVVQGSELLRLEGRDARVQSAAFNSNGTRVVTASSDKTARLWDVATGNLVAQLVGHEDTSRSVAFSSDGQRVVTAGDKTARVWDSRTGEALAVLGGSTDVYFASFSPDGSTVVTVEADNAVRTWESASGKPEASLQHQDRVLSAQFRSDGSAIVTASADNTVRIWEPRTGKTAIVLAGSKGSVRTAAFSPDGFSVVTASDDGARLWDGKSGKLIALLEGHSGSIWSASFSRDGSRIVTASSDGTARVWDAEVGKPVVSLEGRAGEAFSVAFSADASRAVTVHVGKIQVWDGRGRIPFADSIALEGDATAAVMSPDGTRIVAANEQAVRVWDAATMDLIAELRGHEGGISFVACSKDGSSIVALSDAAAYVWQAREGIFPAAKMVAIRSARGVGISSTAVSPDGTTVATGWSDGTVRLRNVSTGEETAVACEHDGSVWSATFSPNGRRIVTTGGKMACVWDVVSGRRLALLTGRHSRDVLVSSFNPDGSMVVTTSDDNTASIWNVAAEAHVTELVGHTGAVTTAVFSADGSRVVTASRDSTARVWDAETGTPLAVLQGHEGDIRFAGFSADDRQVITAATDRTVRMWDVHWVTYQLLELRERVCREKLHFASTLTHEDVASAPILTGREGEDVCSRLSLVSRMWGSIRSRWPLR